MLKPMAVDRGGGTGDGVFYFVEMQFIYMEDGGTEDGGFA